MQQILSTPFGRRPVTSGLLAAQAKACAGRDDACAGVDKWQVLGDQGLARAAFGISDRDMAVLSALVSFHRNAEIEGGACIVFPSNAALSARLPGMAESTQ